MKSRILLFTMSLCTACVCLMFLHPNFLSAHEDPAPSAKIILEAPSGPFAEGSTFVVRLMADIGNRVLESYQVEIEYDPKVLSFVKADKGLSPEFGKPAAVFGFIAGSVSLLDFQFLAGDSPRGLVDLAGLEFKVKSTQPAETSISIISYELLDSVGQTEIVAAVSNAKIFVTGSQPEPSPTPKATATPIPPQKSLIGDADNNGELTMADALLIRQALEQQIPGVPNPKAADANRNGRIDSADANLISQVLCGARPDPNEVIKVERRKPQMEYTFPLDLSNYRLGEFDIVKVVVFYLRPLGAYDLAITYDPDVISVVSVGPGESEEFRAPLNANRRERTLWMNDLQVRSREKPTGDIHVATLQFFVRSKAKERTEFKVSLFKLIDTQGLDAVSIYSMPLVKLIFSHGSGPLPSPTPTLTPKPDPAKPTPTPVGGVPSGRPLVYEFHQESLHAEGWVEKEGGFNGNHKGTYFTNYGFGPGTFHESRDNRGLSVLLRRNEVTYLYVAKAIETKGKAVLLRARIRSNSGGAQVSLGAMKGSISGGQGVDGTLGMSQFAHTKEFIESDGVLVALFKPASATVITPFLQISGTGNEVVNVLIDSVEVYLIGRGERMPE